MQDFLQTTPDTELAVGHGRAVCVLLQAVLDRTWAHLEAGLQVTQAGQLLIAAAHLMTRTRDAHSLCTTSLPTLSPPLSGVCLGSQ